MYKIEDIPVTPGNKESVNPIVHTALQLNVGQSFLVPFSDVKPSTRATVWMTGKRHGKTFSTYTVRGQGLRVGRTS